VRVVVGARSDVGRVREINEDSYLMDEPIFVIADGMGGHIAGDVASSTAVDVIADITKTADARDPNSLGSIVRRANEAIWKKAQADPSLRGMGTTCTLLMVQDATAHLAHVGDSRAYLLRDGELSQLTEDHTLVGRMVQDGRLTLEEAQHHPHRNVITRALGIDSDVQVDVLTFDLIPGDRLLLCSDGLSSMIDAEAIRQTLVHERDPQRAADALVDLANSAGGEDNITVVVLDLVNSGAPPDPRSDDAATGSTPAVTEEPAARTDTPAEPNEARGKTDAVMHPARASPPPESRPRFWLRRLVVGLFILGFLGVAGFFLIRWELANSYFVGVGANGLVTIYQGRPEDFAGISLRSEKEQTKLALTDLPEFMRDDVQQGIKTDSLADARSRVETLEAQAESFRREGTRRQNDSQ
jgi:PPM family protein phosphatase